MNWMYYNMQYWRGTENTTCSIGCITCTTQGNTLEHVVKEEVVLSIAYMLICIQGRNIMKAVPAIPLQFGLMSFKRFCALRPQRP